MERPFTPGPYKVCIGTLRVAFTAVANDSKKLSNASRTVTHTREDLSRDRYALVFVKVSEPKNIGELYIFREFKARPESQHFGSIF